MRRAVWVLTATAGFLAGSAALTAPTIVVYPAYPVVRHQPEPSMRSLWRGAVQAASSPPPAAVEEPRVLWNFTTAQNVSDWTESSDGTEREAGMSTGAFKLQKTATFQRAVMFSLINPQPNGAGFVGFYAEGAWDLSPYSSVSVRCRAQGQGHNYKVYMKNDSDQPARGGSYESYFTLPDNEFRTVRLPLSSFKFYFRGRLVPDAPPLDTSAISRIGLQIYGGVYDDDVKQRGASALEIDSITAE